MIAFQSAASDLVVRAADAAALPAGVTQIYRRDLGATPGPTTTLISQRDGVPGDAPSTCPAVDAAGRLITFETRAGALVLPAAAALAEPTGTDVLLADAELGTLRRVTTRPDGQPAAMGARGPQLSATGRLVVFETIAATELLSDPATAPAQTPGAWMLGIAEYPAELSSSSLDLGTTAVGATSQEWYTTIVNDGEGAFVPASIASTDPAFTITGGTCVAAVPILPGESCTVEVTFLPSIAGPAQTEIVLAERGFGAVEVSVGVAANAGVPTLTATPSANQLGDAVVGTDGGFTIVEFANAGEVAATIDTVAVGGSHPADFPVLDDRCTGTVLEPGSGCLVLTYLHPSEYGPRSATLTATAVDGATASAVVVGSGRYEPLAGMVASSVTIGGRATVVGLGFPANSYLSVSWDGVDESVIVLSDGEGVISATLRAVGSLGAGHRVATIVDPLGRFAPVSTGATRIDRRPTAGASSPAHRGG